MRESPTILLWFSLHDLSFSISSLVIELMKFPSLVTYLMTYLLLRTLVLSMVAVTIRVHHVEEVRLFMLIF